MSQFDAAGPSRVNALPLSKPSQSQSQSQSSSPHPAPSTSKENQEDIALTFASLGLSSKLSNPLSSVSLRSPTAIQTQCIPPILKGRDVIGLAQTGSGKTLAFALPIIHSLLAEPFGIHSLVLTPTRELAAQIHEQFSVLCNPFSFQVQLVLGGLDMMAQSLALGARPHIVIATPGRFADLLKHAAGKWDVGRLKFLVLDEADRLLTSTFAHDLRQIFDAAPKTRQTLLFTATNSPAIRALQEIEPSVPGKQKPLVVDVLREEVIPANLQQLFLLLPTHTREVYLAHILLNPPPAVVPFKPAPPKPKSSDKNSRSNRGKAPKKAEEEDTPATFALTIIFVAKCRTAALLHAMLSSLSIPCAALHSRLSQAERMESLLRFRSNQVPILIATDVASRGLDIPSVALVINFDLPLQGSDYIHRIGRTARAGEHGCAVSMVGEHDVDVLQSIESHIGSKMEEWSLDEDKVLVKLNEVWTAKRVANMKLHDEKFGEKHEINAKKRRKRDRAAAQMEDA